MCRFTYNRDWSALGLQDWCGTTEHALCEVEEHLLESHQKTGIRVTTTSAVSSFWPDFLTLKSDLWSTRAPYTAGDERPVNVALVGFISITLRHLVLLDGTNILFLSPSAHHWSSVTLKWRSLCSMRWVCWPCSQTLCQHQPAVRSISPGSQSLCVFDCALATGHSQSGTSPWTRLRGTLL